MHSDNIQHVWNPTKTPFQVCLLPSWFPYRALSLPVHWRGMCWIECRSWSDIWVFSPNGSVAKSYTPSLTQLTNSCRQLKREGKGSSTRHSSCETEVERTPISSNTLPLWLRWSYSINMNLETVCFSRPSLLCSIRALHEWRGDYIMSTDVKKKKGTDYVK